MIRHYCDKCGKEIDSDTNSKSIDITESFRNRFVFTNLSFELCNDCFKGLAKYLNTETRFDETTDVNNS